MSEPYSRLPRLLRTAPLRTLMSCIFLFMLSLSLYLGSISFSLAAAAAENPMNGSIKVYLKDGGKTTPCATKATTVAEFLDQLSVTLGELDTLSREMSDRLENEDVIRITRREYVEHRESVSIPFETTYSHSPELKPGEELVSAEGKNGINEIIYERFVVNGEVVEETLIDEVVIKKPATRQIQMGFRSAPISKLDFNIEFDENGKPLEYNAVFENQRSAGYSAASGAGTASGRYKAGVGYVAVNPNLIPYGSKLFIQSSDGKYIYGYAIAADTGTALMNGTIAVDCFYDTYQASANHGIKTVDIFVLE